MILIPCVSAMSVICKVKTTFHISPNTCDNISPVRISISVIWPAFRGVVYYFCMVFVSFLSIFYEKWKLPSVLMLGHIHHYTVDTIQKAEPSEE